MQIIKKRDVKSNPLANDVDVQEVGFEPTLTQQQFKDECDINNIMRKHNGNADLALMTQARREGVYADLTGITDYRDMLDVIRYANDAFMTLPADLRGRFQNDPGAFIDYMNDPKNYDEALKFGLLDPEKSQKTIETRKQKTTPENTNDKTNDKTGEKTKSE